MGPSARCALHPGCCHWAVRPSAGHGHRPEEAPRAHFHHGRPRRGGRRSRRPAGVTTLVTRRGHVPQRHHRLVHFGVRDVLRTALASRDPPCGPGRDG